MSLVTILFFLPWNAWNALGLNPDMGFFPPQYFMNLNELNFWLKPKPIKHLGYKRLGFRFFTQGENTICVSRVFLIRNCIYRRIRRADKLHYEWTDVRFCLGPGSSIQSNAADVQGCGADVVRNRLGSWHWDYADALFRGVITALCRAFIRFIAQ